MNDVTINLTVGMACVVEQETPNIRGELKAILVDCDLPSEIIIQSAETPDLRILDVNNIVGSKYYLVRKPCVDKEGNVFNYGHAEISLNETLIVRVKSRSGNNVKVVFRMEE